MNDPVVMRNDKRTSSQLSVFEYPEHLNPFYEDENHKRLRFWKIGKNKDGTSSRRGSFSLGGLRDMWTFKSFRGKKKSSSLGINKTSESPEPVRRSLDPNQSNYSTFDPRVRTSQNNGVLSDNFQRNAPYRTSLQDMRYNTQGSERFGNGFTRNDSYRSTIQIAGRRNELSPAVPPRRYVYGGSVTPQPRNRYDHNYNNSQGISHGSSQVSVASTNPFETDDDDVVIGRLDTDGSSEKPTPAKRHIRKKRRAPPPPVPIPKVIDEEAQSGPTSPSANDVKGNEEKDQTEILNLTAEIESFVKLRTEDEESDTKTKESITDLKIIETNTDTSQSPQKIVTNGVIPHESNELEKTPQPLQREHTPTSVISEHESNSSGDQPASSSSCGGVISDQQSISSEEQTPPIPAERRSTVKKDQTPPITSRSKESSPIASTISVSSKEQTPIRYTSTDHIEASYLLNNSSKEQTPPNAKEFSSSKDHTPLNSSFDTTEDGASSSPPPLPQFPVELKITESKEDVSEISNDSFEKYHIRYIPLKEGSPESLPELRHEMKPLNGSQNEPIQYERRRSVKEIIESINRSQSLLKVNHDQSNTNSSQINDLNSPDLRPPPRRKFEVDNLSEDYNRLKESEMELKRMIVEMENLSSPKETDCYNEDLPGILGKFEDELNNNDIFKKCNIKKVMNRESSPTSSNLDWNPVPKPKRTKNLTNVVDSEKDKTDSTLL